MIQQFRARAATTPEAEARDACLFGEDDEDWRRVRHLAETVEDHELLDPTLSPERLLFRLFHEEGVRVTPATAGRHAAAARASASRSTSAASAPPSSRTCARRRRIEVTCEFCSRKYRFAPGEFA